MKKYSNKYRFGAMLYCRIKRFKEKCIFIRHNPDNGMAIIVFKDSDEVTEVAYEYLERCFRS